MVGASEMVENPVPQNPFLDRLEAQKKAILKNVSGVKKIIAVGSGKGGVGKTFVAVNLAFSFAMEGKSVGLLDCDIDCPNVFASLGITTAHEASEDGKILPIVFDRVKLVSMAGLSENPAMPRIWRGPLIGKAIVDFVSKVEWGNLDILIVDLPPGTSDAVLTLMQLVRLDGFVVVSTNSPSAILDATKSLLMAQEMNVKVLGLVENMRSEIFGQKKVEALAEQRAVSFLGFLSLEKEVEEALSAQKPAILVSKRLKSEFEKIKSSLEEQLENQAV